MKRVAVLSLVLAAAADLFAVRHAVFETDVYNRIFPLECKDNVVFSPVAAEVDCALAAEALDTIPRANVAEAMGVLVEFSGVYRPLLERYRNATNGFHFVNARAFCLPEMRAARADFRLHLQKEYGAEVMSLLPTKGVDCWFRAAMDGEMEDFALSSDQANSGKYLFFDLVSVRAEWLEPFPAGNVRNLPFTTPDGGKRTIPFMSDVRVVDLWDDRDYTLMKLPLRDDCWFYVLLPKQGLDLSATRQDFSFMEIESLLTMTGPMPVGNHVRAPTVVVLPRLALRSRVDFMKALQEFRLPTSDLDRLCRGVAAQEYSQWISFCLFENGRDEPPLESKPVERQVSISDSTRRMVCNRPFLFFVYDGRTATIPVAGQFTGVDTDF